MKRYLFYVHVMVLMCAFNIQASSSSSSSASSGASTSASASASAAAAAAGVKIKVDYDAKAAKAEYDLLKAEQCIINNELKSISDAWSNLLRRNLSKEEFEKKDKEFSDRVEQLETQSHLQRKKMDETAYSRKLKKEKKQKEEEEQQALNAIWHNIKRVPYKSGPEGEKPLIVKVTSWDGLEVSLKIELYPSDNILTIPLRLLDVLNLKYMQRRGVQIKTQFLSDYTKKMTIKDLYLNPNNQEIVLRAKWTDKGYSSDEMRQIYQTQMGK